MVGEAWMTQPGYHCTGRPHKNTLPGAIRWTVEPEPPPTTLVREYYCILKLGNPRFVNHPPTSEFDPQGRWGFSAWYYSRA
jgi:hypothetical protein